MPLPALSSTRNADPLPSKLFGSAYVLLIAITLHGGGSRHALLIQAASWAIVWIYTLIVAKLYPDTINFDDSPSNGRRKRAWAAGSLLVLACLCARAAYGGQEFLWTKVVSLPAVVLVRWLGEDNGPFSDFKTDPKTSSSDVRRAPLLLFSIIILSSAIALLQPFVSQPVMALGICNALCTSSAYILLEIPSAENERVVRKRISRSSDGTYREELSAIAFEMPGVSRRNIQDLAAFVCVGCLLTSFLLEGFRFDGVKYDPQIEDSVGVGKDWRVTMWRFGVLQSTLLALAGGLRNVVVVALAQSNGASTVVFLDLGSAFLAQLTYSLTFIRTWFISLSVVASYCLFYELPQISQSASAPRKLMRARQGVFLLALCSVLGLIVILLRNPYAVMNLSLISPSHFNHRIPTTYLEPMPPATSQSHPIHQLISSAEKSFQDIQSRQSKSLADAIAEYRRRYRSPPPPNFDKWYEFAKSKGVQLIDEYDTIYHSILPFWGLKPSVIRERAREALGFNNALLGLLIREGQVVKVEGGDEWQQKATVGMMKDFVRHLPDMDLPFNVHDEPRVVVPHDDLVRLVARASGEAMPVAFANPSPMNAWSSRPMDVDNGKRLPEVQTTRFNKFAHQHTWTSSRLSCPPESPSRVLDENSADNMTSYAFSALGFIRNQTAFSDICMSPSLQESYGFFDRPNAFDVVHDLFPIFSQSKISSFQDILYPSPWYWAGKVKYDEKEEYDWDKKASEMYWRGSNTGGFSRDGGWRRQHRQRFVQKINSLGSAVVMGNESIAGTVSWKPRNVARSDYQDLFNVKFTYIGQCDPGDCDAQKEFFEVVEPVNMQDAWGYKYLVDIDGNAFSGRFYAFLKSLSLVYKVAVFREWHEEWIRPWVHYIPLGLKGDEYVESVRYFAKEQEGRQQAPILAVQGREWAGKVLRKEDFEVWFFRLLLEYGRVVDDNRSLIGFALA